jgi:LacI family transcriptional regulator
LGGVIIVPQDVTEADLQVLKNRNLPYLLFTESDLPGPRVILGQRDAARQMTKRLLDLGHRRIALLSGYDVSLDATKRHGIHEALREAGIDPAGVAEISAHGNESEMFEAARKVLHLDPRPTAVIAFDDSLGSILSVQARRQEGIAVPGQLSIVSFHDWPYLHFVEPALTTAHFEFFQGGVGAAEALNRSALTGEPLCDICFAPTYREGQTVGPAPTA